LTYLTFNRCFVQSVISRSQNEVIPVALKSWHPYLSENLRQENKIRKSMEIAVFKVKSRNLQCWPLAIPTWISEAIEVQLIQTQLFWISDSKTYQLSKLQQKKCLTREIWFFKDDNWILPANRFREETSPNYIPKHLNRHTSFYFSNLACLSQSLKISCKAISPFLGK